MLRIPCVLNFCVCVCVCVCAFTLIAVNNWNYSFFNQFIDEKRLLLCDLHWDRVIIKRQLFYWKVANECSFIEDNHTKGCRVEGHLIQKTKVNMSLCNHTYNRKLRSHNGSQVWIRFHYLFIFFHSVLSFLFTLKHLHIVLLRVIISAVCRLLLLLLLRLWICHRSIDALDNLKI